MNNRWFELAGLRIRTLRPNDRFLTLVDATEAFAELAECIDALKLKLDVKRPRDRTGAE